MALTLSSLKTRVYHWLVIVWRFVLEALTIHQSSGLQISWRDYCRRTTSKTSREIADQVARVGASLSAGANSDYTIVAASALTRFNEQILSCWLKLFAAFVP
jgi:hypothetical protein